MSELIQYLNGVLGVLLALLIDRGRARRELTQLKLWRQEIAHTRQRLRQWLDYAWRLQQLGFTPDYLPLQQAQAVAQYLQQQLDELEAYQ